MARQEALSIKNFIKEDLQRNETTRKEIKKRKERITHLFIFYLQLIAKNQLQQFIFRQAVEILWFSYLKDKQTLQLQPSYI